MRSAGMEMKAAWKHAPKLRAEGNKVLDNTSHTRAGQASTKLPVYARSK